MLIKVNRVKTNSEVHLLQELKTDIIGFNIDKINQDDEAKRYDSRATSIEEVINIFRVTPRRSKISIHINYYAFSNELLDTIIETLEPDYLNYHLSFSDKENWEKYYLKNLERHDSKKIPSIVFGENFGYDTPFRFTEEVINIVKNLAYLELNSDTINTTNNHYIKTEKELGITQSQTSDLLLETVQCLFDKVPVLIDDKFNIETIVKDLKRVKAKGVTFSLRSKENDIFTSTKEVSFFSEMSLNYNSLESIVEFIKKIKKN